MIRVINNYNDNVFFHENTYHKDFKTNPHGFHFPELIAGEADVLENSRLLNFVSKSKKTYFLCSGSIYPFLSQLDTILRFYEDQDMLNSVELIVDIVSCKRSNFSKWIDEILNNKQIKYVIVDSEKYDYLNINNFFIVGSQEYRQDGIFCNLYENTLSFVSNSLSQKPFRKVFISRKLTPNYHDTIKRCDDHDKLEQIFLNNGFEICYPETQFHTFSEQVTYFNETKVLCGLSGGGLSNAIFMQPEGKILEITTSFKFDYGIYPSELMEEIHEYYLHIAWHRKHAILTISNVDRTADEIERQLEKFKVLDWLK